MAKKREGERNFEVHTNPHPERLFHILPATVLRTLTPEEAKKSERELRAFAALQKWRGKRFWKKREFVFTPEDEQAFTDLLKETFPNIRFLDQDALGEGKHQAYGERRSTTEPELRYFDSLADPSNHTFICWLEPKGWQPKIGPTRFAPNSRCILNEPPLQFKFHPARVVHSTAYSYGDTFRQKDKPLPPTWSRPSGRLQANPCLDDTEYKAFLGKAYKLVTKIATNKLIPTDPLTGWSHETPRPRGEPLWAGHHAIAWCRENPRHFLGSTYRPADEAEWRCKIPREHPDYLSFAEASERLVERIRFDIEKQNEEHRKFAEAKSGGARGKSKKQPARKRPKSANPPKKRGG